MKKLLLLKITIFHLLLFSVCS